MAISKGTMLGSYEVLGLLGAGGMGEVYRAHDTKLARDVALKVLPEAFARDPDRLARFRREAHLLASLNHENIAAVYGLDDSGDVHYLVMEYVPGETLAQRVSAGPVEVAETLKIAVQIAAAVEAAHEKAVVHRDLKPANVKVTPEGKVKVLDFGLAKALADEVPEGDAGDSPTLTASPTVPGVILGTAAYMAPEQARGKKVDKRADLWAFGCVVYELLTAQRAFRGEDVTETLAAVLKGEPEWQALPAETPASVRSLLRRCVQKDVQRRLQHIGDARVDLEETILAASTTAVRAPAMAVEPRALWRRAVPFVLTGIVAALVTAGIVIWNLRPAPATGTQQVSRAIIPLPPNEALAGTNAAILALSPDGTHLAYVASSPAAGQQLYLRAMDSLESRPISGTEGATSPFFSPDGQWLGFFAGGKLKKVSVSGGAALTLCGASNPRGAAWAPNDTILFGPSNGEALWQVPAAGGEP